MIWKTGQNEQGQREFEARSFTSVLRRFFGYLTFRRGIVRPPTSSDWFARTCRVHTAATAVMLVCAFILWSCTLADAPRTVGPISLDSISPLDEGDSAQLKLTGESLNQVRANWSSSDRDIVDVSNTGALLARGAGVAIVTASAANQRASTSVIVRRHQLPDLYIVAHRGFAGVFPENTLTAVKGAYDRGADAVEVDVMMAKDRVPIIMHDDRVDRTTNGTGLVSSFTSAQLQQLDACSKFGAQWLPCPVPLATEVMQAARGRGRLLLHLKGPWPAGALDTLLELVRAEQIRRQTVVIDFDTITLSHVRHVDPAITVGLLSTTPVDPVILQRLEDAVVLLYDSTFVATSAGDIRVLRTQALAAGNSLGAWTIYGVARSKQLRSSGAGWLITDVELPKDSLAAIPIP